MSDPKRKEREPKSMRELVESLVAGRGWADNMAVDRVRHAWPSIVGEQVAARTRPVSLADGVLTVIGEGAWATELTLLAGRVGERVREFLGGAGPIQVKVVVRSFGRNDVGGR